jgi:hypothetical protein
MEGMTMPTVKFAKLDEGMAGKVVSARISGVKGICKVEVLRFGTCGLWCRLRALECSDKKLCCGDEAPFRVSDVRVVG